MVSGLPGSGKTWLASRLAPLLGLPVIDKDDILERLFDLRGTGDPAWRRILSRESDGIFRRESEDSAGALLVSLWHLPGMSQDSGTPTDWLERFSDRIVNLHCECPADIAAARFIRRKRHVGHLDDTRSHEEILKSIQDLTRFKPPEIGKLLTVDTSTEIKLAVLARRISAAFEDAQHNFLD